MRSGWVLALAAALLWPTVPRCATGSGPDPGNEAQRLYREGRLTEAETILRGALDARPDQARLQFLLGLVLRDGSPSRPDEAVAAFTAALALDPAQEDTAGALAGVLLDGGRTDEAETFLRKRVADHPEEATSLRLLGSHLARVGQAGEGIPLLKRAIRIVPELPPAWLELGRARLRNGDAKGAIKALEEGRRLAPDSPSMRYSLAQAYLADGREEEGSVEMEAYAAAEEAFARRDQERIESRRLGQAIADYQRRLQANPDLSVSWYVNLLALHELAETTSEAERFFQQLAADHPGRGAPRLGLALLADREDRNLAWRLLVDAHRLEPASATPLQGMSRIADTSARRAELGLLLAAAEAQPGASSDIPLLRGIVALEEGNLTQAQEHLERARVARPSDPAVLMNLGVTYARRGQADAAIELFGELLDQDPGNRESRFNRALAQAGRGDLEAAAVDLEHLLEVGYEEPRALNLLARIRETQSRPGEAMSLLQRSLAVEPDQPTFREMLERLQAGREAP